MQKVTGHVWCWGYNSYKMVGRSVPHSAPKPYTTSSPPSRPSVSRFCSPNINDEYDGVPRRVKFAPSYTSFLSATSIAVGNYHVCALVQDSNVYCWGYNVDGAVSQLICCTRVHHVQRHATMPCHASHLPVLA